MRHRKNNDPEIASDAQWISLSDLMTGLMMVFMLIAVAFMLKVEAENKKTKEIAIIYDAVKTQIYNELYAEFKDDLNPWGAELTKDLVLRFKEPSVLFATGQDQLKPNFENILSDFFPRYIQRIMPYKTDIKEVRIEGHTSSFWYGVSSDEAYFQNMALSQSRTRSTLRYVLSTVQLAQNDYMWLKKAMTANGLSSSHPIMNTDGSENISASQRVEFRILTDAESQLSKIKEMTQNETP